MKKRAVFVVYALVLVFIVFVINAAFAAPSDIGNTSVYPKPTAPTLPPAGGKYIDPTFGSEILRVTDRNDGNQIVHSYSSDGSSFNADSTRFVIRSSTEGTLLYSLDPDNFVSTRIGPLWNGISLDWTMIQWDSTDPKILYGIDQWGLKLYQYEPDTGVYTLIKDFTELLPLDQLAKDNRALSYLQKSNDDRWFSFVVGRLDGGGGTYPDKNLGVMVAYDSVTDTVYQYDFYANHGMKWIHAAVMDKSGKFVYLNKSGEGERFSWNIVDGSVEVVSDDLIQRAIGHKVTGTEALYNVDGTWDRMAILKRDLKNPQHWSFVFKPSFKDWTQVAHYSLNHWDESTIFASYYFATQQEFITLPWQSEIFQVWVDGTSLNKTRRLAHHRSEPFVGNANSYWSSPRASSSLDGRFVIYSSNWDGSDYIDTFILKVPSINPTPINTDSISHWAFDEESGVVAGDSSVNGNNATVEGAASWATGKVGGALSFDGIDDYVDVDGVSSLDNLGPLTYAVWIKPDSLTTQFIIAKDHQTKAWDVSTALSMTMTSFKFEVKGETSLVRATNWHTAVANQWQHIAVTWDGGASASGVHIYINGSEVESYRTSIDGVALSGDTGTNIRIGAREDGRFMFGGQMDEVSIYDRELSEEEVMALYDSTGNP